MRLSSLLLLILFGVSGCNVSGEKALTIKEYFDLDSLLDHQIELIANSNLKLDKKVMLDGQIEEKTFDPDTAMLTGEFKIIREFDLNKTNYIGAYEVISNGGITKYLLKPGQNSPVDYLEIQKGSDGKLEQLKGVFFEDKEIYQHQREIQIIFKNGQISAYSIKGYQHMIMKDTVQFLTQAIIR
ncbi:MAG: hypothetical protein ACFHWX_19820 [Bacteroidota bacterium]